jgi:hypothetical protein
MHTNNNEIRQIHYNEVLVEDKCLRAGDHKQLHTFPAFSKAL